MRQNWNREILLKAADEFGTPLFVYDSEIVEYTHEDIREQFLHFGIKPKIFFSVKTNPIAEVLRCVFSQGAGAEVVNEYEFWLAQKLGLPSEKIIVNGTVKSDRLIEQAVRSNVGLFSVEDFSELKKVSEISAKMENPPNLSLRINPCLRTSIFDFTTLSGTRRSGTGFVIESDELNQSIELILSSGNLKLKGLNFHLGSGIENAAPYKYAIRKIINLWKILIDKGMNVEIIDIGGGFGLDSVSEINLLQAVKSFGFDRAWKPIKKRRDNLFGELAKSIQNEISLFVNSAGISFPEIWLEPGRSLVASSHLLLLKVVKVADKKRKTIYCNGGAMNISPLLLTEYHRVENLSSTDNTRTDVYDIFGSLPTPLDNITKRRRLAEVHAGDILAVFDTGAYFTSLSNNFAGPRPAVVSIESGEPVVIRERESFEDLLNG